MMSRFVFKILEQSSEFTIPGCELLFVDKKYGTQICALFRGNLALPATQKSVMREQGNEGILSCIPHKKNKNIY